MAKGKVKFFSNRKGFGFVIGDDDNKEYFVHFSSIVMEGYKTLKENQEVTYEPVDTDKGLQASNVVPGEKILEAVKAEEAAA